MSLKEQIYSDFINAMKTQNQIAKASLSSVKAKIVEAEKSNPNWEPNDAEVLKIIIKAIKQREESQSIYEKACRVEQAQAESDEADVLRVYLPKPMSEENIEISIRGIVSDLIGVVPNQQALVGKTLGEFNKRFNGRADISLVKKIIEKVVGL
jgi:hypothetical protein